MMRHIIFFSIKKIITIFFLLGVFSGFNAQTAWSAEPVLDQAKLLSNESKARMNRTFKKLLKEVNIQLQMVTLPRLSGAGVSEKAAQLMNQLRIGDKTGFRRGALLLFVVDQQTVKFEIGYDLEHVFPDAFVSTIERTQMTPYFQARKVSEGIEATVELIAKRAFENFQTEPVPRVRQAVTGARSGGAGLERDVPISHGTEPVNLAPENAHQAVNYPPQTSVENAWQTFMLINKTKNTRKDLDFYSEETKNYLKTRPMTEAGFEHVVRLYEGKHYEIKEAGARAVVLFPDDPQRLLAPWFFIRTEKGWQFDGASLPKLILYNHLNQWHFSRADNPYQFAFLNYTFTAQGFAVKNSDSKVRAFLGVTVQQVDRRTTDGRREGILFASDVIPQAPAAQAGIKQGDLILRFDGRPMHSVSDFNEFMSHAQVGQRLRIDVLRSAGATQHETSLLTFYATLGAKP